MVVHLNRKLGEEKGLLQKLFFGYIGEGMSRLLHAM